MTLTNHLLTGSVLAKLLPLPLAIPLAFMSHFALDALPHFGLQKPKTQKQRLRNERLFKSSIVIDLLLAIGITLWLLHANHPTWVLTGLVAFSPDLIWVYRYIAKEKYGKLPPTKSNLFIRFHSGIQKFERVWGWAVEVFYAYAMVLILR